MDTFFILINMAKNYENSSVNIICENIISKILSCGQLLFYILFFNYINYIMNNLLFIRNNLGESHKIITHIGMPKDGIDSIKFKHPFKTDILAFLTHSHKNKNKNKVEDDNPEEKIFYCHDYSNSLLSLLNGFNITSDVIILNEEIDSDLIDLSKFINYSGYIINNTNMKFKNSLFFDIYFNNTVLYKYKKIDDSKKIYYDKDIKFAIVTCTFYRKDGRTRKYLERCLECINNQIYKNWDLIIVGDKYEPESELLEIIENIRAKMDPHNKLIYIKNDDPPREYIKDKKKLWYIASSASLNLGLQYCRDNGYKYYVHTDDDDFWTKDHLQYFYYIFKRYPSCVFSTTRSTYGDIFLPKYVCEIAKDNIFVCGGTIIHSAIVFRCDIIDTKYFITKDENILERPADFLLLEDIGHFIQKNKKYCGVYIPYLTCYHDEEGTLWK
jgi:hypothetical protein